MPHAIALLSGSDRLQKTFFRPRICFASLHGACQQYRVIPLDELEASLFLPLVGQTFQILEGDRSYPLVLEAVRELGYRRPDAKRDPFALAFRGNPGLRVPQRVYQITHPELGTLEFFLTQNSANPAGAEIEAVFN